MRSHWQRFAKYRILFAVTGLLIEVHEPSARWFVRVTGLRDLVIRSQRMLADLGNA
jgi:hypothetical protein